MKPQGSDTQVITVLNSAHPEDCALCDEILKHMRALEQTHAAIIRHDSKLLAGDDRKSVEDWLTDSALVLVLLSVDLALDEKWPAILSQLPPERILTAKLRACHIEGTPWARWGMSGLTQEPLNQAADRDRAIVNLVEEVDKILRRLLSSKIPASKCNGREDELAQIVRWLEKEDKPRVVLFGAPGIGKTTLAAAAALRAQERFNRGALWVRCDALQSGEDVVRRIAHQLAIPRGVSKVDIWICEALRNTLLVLDNAESPWASDEAGMEGVLHRISGVLGIGIVLTLRGRKRPGAGWKCMEVQGLQEDKARGLFLEEVGDDFAGDPALVPLLRWTAGIPLAIIVLARRAQGEPKLRVVLEALSQVTSEERLVTCFSTALASRALTPAAHTLLRGLAFLPDGLPSEDIPDLTNHQEHEAASPLRKTALAYDQDGRIRVLAPLREYVRAQHATHDDEDRVRIHCFKFARKWGPQVGEHNGADAAKRLSAEIGNLETLIRAGLNSTVGIRLDAIDAMIQLIPFIRYSGLGDVRLLKQAGDVASGVGDLDRARKCLVGLAEISLDRIEYTDAHRYYEDALALCDHGRHGEVFPCLLGLGHVARYHCEPAKAKDYYGKALRWAEERGDQHALAMYFKSMGHTALEQPAFGDAARYYEMALTLFGQMKNRREVANCQRSKALVHIKQRRFDDAGALLRQAMEAFAQVGDGRGEADCNRALGTVAQRQGQLDAAIAHFRRADELYCGVQDRRGRGLCHLALGRAFAGPSAREYLLQALHFMEGSPSYRTLSEIHAELARIAESAEERARHQNAAEELRARINPPASS